MTLRIDLNSTDFSGGTAEYFDPVNPFSAWGVPTAVAAVSGEIAEFTGVTAGSLVSLRISDSGNELLRTGIQPTTEVGEADGTTFEMNYMTLELAGQEIDFSELENGLGLPISEDGVELTSINLTRSGQHLVATGGALIDTGILGLLGGTYTYEFELVRSTSAMSSRLLSVETVDIDVNIAGAGWIINSLINLVLDLFEGKVGGLIEDFINDAIDDEVTQRLEEDGQGIDNVQTTVQTITVGTSAVTLDVLAAFPLANLGCIALPTSGSVRVRDAKQLRQLRRMRSAVLKGNPRGDSYIRLMRRHGPEMVQIVRKNRDLLKKLDQVIESGLNDFSEDSPESGKLSKKSAALGREFAAELKERAKPRLRRAIELAEIDIDEFVDTPVREVLDRSSKEFAELAKKQPRRPRRRNR